MRRHIIGIQVHHSTLLDDAMRGAVNACAGLRGAHNLTDNRDLLELLDAAQDLAVRITHARRDAGDRLQQLYEDDPQTFRDARAGRIPWPDETAEGFQPRCTCSDRCLHEQGIEPGPLGICNCPGVKRPCPAHG